MVYEEPLSGWRALSPQLFLPYPLPCRHWQPVPQSPFSLAQQPLATRPSTWSTLALTRKALLSPANDVCIRDITMAWLHFFAQTQESPKWYAAGSSEAEGSVGLTVQVPCTTWPVCTAAQEPAR